MCGSNPLLGIYDIGDGGRIDSIVSSRGGSALWSTLESPLIGYAAKFMRATFALPVLSAALLTLSVCFSYSPKLVMSPSIPLALRPTARLKTEARNQRADIFRPRKLSSEATLPGRTAAATEASLWHAGRPTRWVVVSPPPTLMQMFESEKIANPSRGPRRWDPCVKSSCHNFSFSIRRQP